MNGPGDTNDEWQRIAGGTQVLIRSRIEIARFLTEVMLRQSPLSAFFIGEEALFVSQLRHVDPKQEFLLADYSGNRMANSALLSASGTTFSCSHSRGTIEFLVVNPANAMYDALPVVRFDFPDMLMLTQRRAHRRITTVPEVPLDCIADAGGIISFECKITDIGRGGLGAMVYDDAINLKPGTVLKGCKIVHPSGIAIKVDIEVRHCSNIVLADGTSARRAGCSFIGAPSEIEELIKVFVLNMEKPEDG